MPTTLALRSIDQPAISNETNASATHTQSQAFGVGCCVAIREAVSALTPIATCPQPEMPVKAEARSIVSRM